MTEPRLYRRIRRRELHRSRSGATVVTLVVVALLAALIGTECALAALGRPPLLIAPGRLLGLAVSGSAITETAGAVVALLGAVALLLALLPGRRSRHSLAHDRLAVVVDDAVIAGALLRDARRSAALAPDRVAASVSRRRASVRLTPTSGIPIDVAAVRESADSLLAELGASPSVRAVVDIASKGEVGS
ncbi:hypothetical protein [Galbitalea soli]|uniref:DNA/RNA endonuclease G n=1 Tax=Galbitalea soli TaxID=1268042 RepID=A0A7C9TRX5_9MICO|nr:hypothetical protein [Galbitalea soli]NEM91622.1 hypothetical protein [Galbitalea soli]NYJ30316.1 hypothetical protein [Galbitalea soli]